MAPLLEKASWRRANTTISHLGDVGGVIDVSSAPGQQSSFLGDSTPSETPKAFSSSSNSGVFHPALIHVFVVVMIMVLRPLLPKSMLLRPAQVPLKKYHTAKIGKYPVTSIQSAPLPTTQLTPDFLFNVFHFVANRHNSAPGSIGNLRSSSCCSPIVQNAQDTAQTLTSANNNTPSSIPDVASSVADETSSSSFPVTTLSKELAGPTQTPLSLGLSTTTTTNSASSITPTSTPTPTSSSTSLLTLTLTLSLDETSTATPVETVTRKSETTSPAFITPIATTNSPSFTITTGTSDRAASTTLINPIGGEPKSDPSREGSSIPVPSTSATSSLVKVGTTTAATNTLITPIPTIATTTTTASIDSPSIRSQFISGPGQVAIATDDSASAVSFSATSSTTRDEFTTSSFTTTTEVVSFTFVQAWAHQPPYL
ncbi:hypothetical protein B0F90DRAFT_1819993 [Multifurca ochricompacta]|uniref:Uncharacterized protein n=1 Tax=Multifurca ochricompacta TaxID=376703 RepID=A0AAD4LZ51_9AGAM|nr:hypothetical protein B0F90DRAFT_1819993 [Multifurca ochricompacta]